MTNQPTPSPCYYCSRPEGAPHLPECPKAPAPRIDWGDIRLEESVLAFQKNHEQNVAKVLGGFVTAQANPTPPGALRPPTRDELAAYERSKLPVEKWASFNRHAEEAIRSCGVTKGEMRHPSKAPTPETMKPVRDALREAMLKLGPVTSLPIPSDDDCAVMWHATHRDHVGYDKAAETCGGFCDDELPKYAKRTSPVEFDPGRLSPTWMACSCGGNSGDHTSLCRKYGR